MLETISEALEEGIHSMNMPELNGSSEKRPEKILKLLFSHPKMTISELAKVLKLSTRAIEKNLKKLQESNRLRWIGPARGGHWEVLMASEED